MRNTKVTLLILALSFFIPFKGFANDEITWLTTHWPPFMELDESRQRIVGGQIGTRLKLLQASLSDYEHMNREMSWNRFWSLIKKEEKICNCLALKNQKRKEFTEFSIPIGIALPNHIIMRKETAKQLGFPKSLSLITLMKDLRFRGLLIGNRSYSSKLDDLLQQREKGSNITRIIVDERTLLKMLDKKRMDYILEYPFVLTRTIKRDLPDLKDKFIAIPITEIAPFYFIYVACPKNKWGKEVTIQINRALKKLRATPPFRNALKESYSGDNLKIIFDFYDTHLLQINE